MMDSVDVIEKVVPGLPCWLHDDWPVCHVLLAISHAAAMTASFCCCTSQAVWLVLKLSVSFRSVNRVRVVSVLMRVVRGMEPTGDTANGLWLQLAEQVLYW